MTGVLKIRGEDRDTFRSEDDVETGRGWGDVSTRPGMEDCHQKLGERHRADSPSELLEELTLLISSFQNCERIYLCGLKPSRWW